MRRLVAVVSLALVAEVIALAVASSGAVADRGHRSPVRGIGIRLVDVPTATADDPRARTYIIDNLAPGSVIERRVQVINGTSREAQVSMYAARARIRNGDFTGARGHKQGELSTWTSTSPQALPLPAHGREFVNVTIRVPRDAAPGERYGVVWAEVTTPPRTPGGLTQVSRVGVRLYVSIGPGGAPASDFEVVSLTASRDTNGDPMVQAAIRNTGGRALDLGGALSLSDGPGGLSAGPFPITIGTTLGIGQTEPVSVSLDEQVPDGPWLAEMTVVSGVTKRKAHATLTFPEGPGSGTAVPAEGSSSATLWMIVAGVATLLVLLLVLAVILLRRRKIRRVLDETTRDSVLSDA